MALLGLLLASPAFAQGLIQVATFRPLGLGGVATRALAVPILDRDGRTYLTGSDYSAQLFAGRAGTPVADLLPVGRPLSFEGGNGFLLFGFQAPVVVAIPGVPEGSRAQVQLRIWDNAGGSVTNWASATIRGASASFLSSPLARSTAFPIDIPALDGIQTFGLEPAAPVTGPVDGVFLTAYVNSHYRSGFFSPSSTSMPFLSGDGLHLLTKFVPDSGRSDPPALVDLRRARRATTWQAPSNLPVLLTRENLFRSIAGVSSDASVIAINDFDATPESYLLVDSARVDLGLQQVTALSRDGRKVFGLARSGDLVRFDRITGETVVLKPRLGSTPNLMEVSRDGSVAVVNRTVWREGQDAVPVGLPSSFDPEGISGDGMTLVGASQNRPATLSLRQQPFAVTVFGEAARAVGRLVAASYDASVMCGSVYTPRGHWTVFTSDGRGYKLNELLPGSGAGLESHAAIQISDDGRTVFGTGASSIAEGTDSGWVADLVLPGDGPRIQGLSKPNNRPGVSFSTRVGYRYQLESRISIAPSDSWSPHGSAIEGDGAEKETEFGNGDESRFFRLVVSPL